MISRKNKGIEQTDEMEVFLYYRHRTNNIPINDHGLKKKVPIQQKELENLKTYVVKRLEFKKIKIYI